MAIEAVSGASQRIQKVKARTMQMTQVITIPPILAGSHRKVLVVKSLASSMELLVAGAMMLLLWTEKTLTMAEAGMVPNSCYLGLALIMVLIYVERGSSKEPAVIALLGFLGTFLLRSDGYIQGWYMKDAGWWMFFVSFVVTAGYQVVQLAVKSLPPVETE